MHFTGTKSSPYQSPTKKGAFLYFAIILTKALPKRLFYSIFALNLTKALPQRVILSIFAVILTKALSKRVEL